MPVTFNFFSSFVVLLLPGEWVHSFIRIHLSTNTTSMHFISNSHHVKDFSFLFHLYSRYFLLRQSVWYQCKHVLIILLLHFHVIVFYFFAIWKEDRRLIWVASHSVAIVFFFAAHVVGVITSCEINKFFFVTVFLLSCFFFKISNLEILFLTCYKNFCFRKYC